MILSYKTKGAAPVIQEAAKIAVQGILHRSSLRRYQVRNSCLDRSGTGVAKQDLEVEEAVQTDIELEQMSYSFSSTMTAYPTRIP